MYRDGYKTMMINNITGSSSLHTNCEPDDSTAILANVHDFISQCKDQSTDGMGDLDIPIDYERFVDSDDSVDFHSLPEGEDRLMKFEEVNTFNSDLSLVKTKLNLIESEAGSHNAAKVCQKVFKHMKCDSCRDHLNLMGDAGLITTVQEVLCKIHEKIPSICFEHELKEKLLTHIQSIDIDPIGCREHEDELAIKIKKSAVDQAISLFCSDVNKILSGTITILPDNPNSIQKLAFEHRRKKRGIGKHSDIFNC